MSKKPPKKGAAVSEFLRQAIRDSGLTAYRIAKDSGTTPEVVARFVAGADIRVSTVDKICDVLGLELSQVSSKKGKK